MGEYDLVAVEFQQKSAVSVEQVYYDVYEKDKLRALVRLIDTEPEFYTLIFCRTRAGSDRLADKLNKLGYDVEALHGDVSQAGRERILDKFKKGHATILVATDVAARGIDVNDLSHVINFDLPDSPEQYVHRIGRTGRAGKTGKAISLVAPRDRSKLRSIIRVTKTDIAKEKLPAGEEVLEIKRNAVLKKLDAVDPDDIPQEFYDFAKKIIDEKQTKMKVAALLKLAFGNQLRPSSYAEIQEPTKGGGGGGGRRGGGGGRPRFEKHGPFRPKKKFTGPGKPKKTFGKKKRSKFKSV
jgi:ATP-dependent RNA helicase DeaD